MSRRKKNRKFGYEDDPPAQEARQLATPARTMPSSVYKNKKVFCRGKIGGERHADHLEVVMADYAALITQRGLRARPCGRAEWWPKRWSCWHEERCANCGKTIRASLGEDCPDWTTDVTIFRNAERQREYDERQKS